MFRKGLSVKSGAGWYHTPLIQRWKELIVAREWYARLVEFFGYFFANFFVLLSGVGGVDALLESECSIMIRIQINTFMVIIPHGQLSRRVLRVACTASIL